MTKLIKSKIIVYLLVIGIAFMMGIITQRMITQEMTALTNTLDQAESENRRLQSQIKTLTGSMKIIRELIEVGQIRQRSLGWQVDALQTERNILSKKIENQRRVLNHMETILNQ